MQYSVLDTFAGASGFSLGFELAGAKVVGAIEIDSWACETFKYNHPNATVMQHDIIALTDKHIVDTFGKLSPDIILGDPPCQGFSICNKNSYNPVKDYPNQSFNPIRG